MEIFNFELEVIIFKMNFVLLNFMLLPSLKGFASALLGVFTEKDPEND